MSLSRSLFFLLLFTICHDPVMSQDVNLWEESFESFSSFPSLWDRSSSSWSLESGSAARTGQNYIQHKGPEAASMTSPDFDLSMVSSMRISYYARRSSTYSSNAFEVRASIDGGVSFPFVVLDSLSALPSSSSSSYSEIATDISPVLLGNNSVIFRWTTVGGKSASSVVRIDDVLFYGQGSIPRNVVSLSGPEEVFVNRSFDLSVDLQLDQAEDGMAGISFQLDFSPESLEFISADLGSVVPESWSMETNSLDSLVKFLVLGNGVDEINEGLHEGVIRMNFNALGLGRSSLEMSDLLAAQSIPSANELPIELGEASLSVLVRDAVAIFRSETDSLEFGMLHGNEASRKSLWVYNDGDSIDLIIDSVGASSPQLSVDPFIASIPVGDSLEFSVELDPNLLPVGAFESSISFHHNASAEASNIVVSATIEPNRGDTNRDSIVDLSDLVLTIDFALDRIQADVSQLFAADNFPFPLGDGDLDVRDLTVMVYAILRDRWPDDSPLPRTGKVSSKIPLVLSNSVIDWVQEGEGIFLDLPPEIDIRAVYLESSDSPSNNGSHFLAANHEQGYFKSLAYKTNNPISLEDSLGFPTPSSNLQVFKGYAVSADASKYAIAKLGQNGSLPRKQLDITIFPNPVSKSSGGDIKLHFSEAKKIDFDLINILGQYISSHISDENGKARISVLEIPSPGLYLAVPKNLPIRKMRPFLVVQ